MIGSLEPDGWHVDYPLKASTALGGGLHYLMHGATGTITKKRYEH